VKFMEMMLDLVELALESDFHSELYCGVS